MTVCQNREKLLGIPSMKAAGPRPEPLTSALPVTTGLKVKLPFRVSSLGARRFWARRMSVPNLMVWLPLILVHVLTNCSTHSRCWSGQLHWPTASPNPSLNPPFPLIWNCGKPEVSGRPEKFDVGYSGCLTRILAVIQGLNVDAVAHVAEPEIGQQGRTEYIVEAADQILVAHVRYTGEADGVIPGPPATGPNAAGEFLSNLA